MGTVFSGRRLAILLGIFSVLAEAAPAAWYRWRSPEAERDICAQIMPGPGWVIVKGPYEDAHCKKPGTPGNAWK